MGFNGNLYFELLNYVGSSINSNISNNRISGSNSILKTLLKFLKFNKKNFSRRFYPDPEKSRKTSPEDYSGEYRDDRAEIEPISGSGGADPVPEQITFQTLLLTTKSPKRWKPERAGSVRSVGGFEQLIAAASDYDQTDFFGRRNDVPFPETDRAASSDGHRHFVYLPRDELFPRFDEIPAAPDLGISFDDWLADSGVGKGPKDFVGTSLNFRRRRRRRRRAAAENLWQKFFGFLKQKLKRR